MTQTVSTKGLVNFPTDSPDFKDSGEGGLYVKLVITVDQDYSGSSQFMCCVDGGGTYTLYDNVFVGDDFNHPVESGPEREIQTIDDILADKGPVAQQFHFPNFHKKDDEVEFWLKKYLSMEYMAVVMMGSTSWSGWSEEVGHYWRATYADLTDDGKALYDSLRGLYGPNAVPFLQTWLDT